MKLNRKKETVLAIGIIVILIISVAIGAIISNPDIFSVDTPNSPTATPITTPSPSPSHSPSPFPSAAPTSKPAVTAQPTASPTAAPTAAPIPTPAPTPIPTPTPMPSIDPASIVFSDGFQSGNTSAWTNTDQSGVNLGVKNSMLECSTNAPTTENWGYVYKWLNQSYTSLYWRWYLFFGNLPTTDGNIIGAGGMYNSAIEGNFTPANGVCSLNVASQGGVYHWTLFYVNSTSVCSVNSTAIVSPNSWYLVELKAVQGAGNGEVHFYLNNVEALNATGLTNNHNKGIDHVSVGGGITASQPVTWYSAGAVAATEYVGPEPSAVPNAISVTSQAADQNIFSGYVTNALSSLVLTVSKIVSYF
jgi:hypothetical protein